MLTRNMPNTWFAPVNASQNEHATEQAQCADADEIYLHGYNSESPFLSSTHHDTLPLVVEAEEMTWTCSNQTSWDEGECRPGGSAIGEAKVANAAACCSACSDKEACAAWVYRSDRKGGDNCWLKGSNSKTTKDVACTSAGIGPVK